MWETLYYDTAIKQRLLRYATSALLFSERGVNPTLIAWNRVVLLHGPPGTGKTSLCKALAQKLAIKLSSRCDKGLVGGGGGARAPVAGDASCSCGSASRVLPPKPRAAAAFLACRYSHGMLIEVNAHSLFSKWFSESGKLIGRLFSKIREVVEDEDALVFVLIDEVESLTAAR